MTRAAVPTLPRSIPVEPQRLVAREADTAGTGLAFFSLCLYLLSQCFQIPLVAVGPSWAVWPVLSDLAAGLMLLSLLISGPRLWIRHRANDGIYKAFGLAVVALCVAFLLSSLRSVTGVGDYERGTSFGIFQIYRLLEFLVVFRVAAGVPLTARRLATLSWMVGLALLLAFLGMVGTFTGALPTPLLVSHLPSDIGSAGPWVSMSNGQWYEAGTIGYNHSYGSVQLLMLGALALALLIKKRTPILEAGLLLMTIGGVFITGSRAGMAAAIVFVLAMFVRRPASAAASLVIFLLLFSVNAGILDLDLGVGATTERQLTLGRAHDPENLSGRAEIWQDSIQLLQEDPLRWLVGVGPGYIAQSGNNAHMLYLHIIIEGGIIGLLIFAFAMRRILKSLYAAEVGERPLFWASIALLVSSLTQETLYPVPAMGHFLGLFLCSVAIVVSAEASHRSPFERKTA